MKKYAKIKASPVINILFLIAGIAMIVYYILLGVFVRFGQSLQFLWLAVGLLCVARFFFWLKPKKFPKGLLIFIRSCVGALVALFIAVEGIILFGCMMTPVQDLDCIIVLGARVNGREPSGALRNRIEVAGEYLEANPDTIAILSGGQGSDEEISEAQCMYENLTAMGIDPERLIMEDNSTDTSENMRFSRELIPEGAQNIGIVTNNFHIFRSLAIARAEGLENISGVPVPTSLLSYPHYMMREFIGVAWDFVRGNLAF